MAWWPALATIGGSIISAMGQRDTNSTNMEIQQNNSAFNAQEAEKNRAFQAQQVQGQNEFNYNNMISTREWTEDMSNSSWQRGMADMNAAGMNPMLAFSQGGASSPQGTAVTGGYASGATASAGQPGNQQNLFANAAHSAQQVAQIANIQADTDKKKAEEENTKEDTRARQSTDPEGTPLVDEERWQRIKNIRQDTNVKKSIEQLNDEQKKLVNENIKNAIENNANIKADTRDITANAVLRELAEAEARNKSTHQEKYPGYNQDVKPFLEDANRTINSAGAAIRMRLRK